MSKRRLVIAEVLSGRSQAEVACVYGVSQGWISRLLARYRVEGDAAFEPRSRRPRSSPTVTPPATVELIVRLRKQLAEQGLDAGPDTIVWHLAHHHGVSVSRATVARYLLAEGLVIPQPEKRPKSSYTRFAADLPNECWQADFTHYRLTGQGGRAGPDVEILCWIDDHSRYALLVGCSPTKCCQAATAASDRGLVDGCTALPDRMAEDLNGVYSSTSSIGEAPWKRNPSQCT